MEKFLWIPGIISDMSHFCDLNRLPETKAALDAALDAFAADDEMNQIRSELTSFVDAPKNDYPAKFEK